MQNQPTIQLCSLGVLLWSMISAGCAVSQKQPSELLPTRSSLKTGPFVIHSHEKLRKSDPVVRELESLTRQVVAKIGAGSHSSENLVDVYILADETSFQHFLQYYHPELPERRAYFIATKNARSVYTFAGDHLMEDLRHEATHAIVNLTHPGVPLWLDEGLAEVFEHPDSDPLPDNHSERFLVDIRAGFVPNLNHLETVDDVRKLTPTNYREAWAWARWGLEGPEPVQSEFRAYMNDVAKLGLSESQKALKSLSERWASLPESSDLNPAENRMLAWIQQNRPESGGRTEVAKVVKTDSSVSRTRLQDQSDDESKPVQLETLNRMPQSSRFTRIWRSIWGG